MAAPFHVYGFNSLIGGADGDLDNIDHTDADGRGTPLQVDDYAVGSDDANKFTVYQIRDTGAGESSPDIIAPDSGGSLRWYRLDMVDAVFAAHLASSADPHGSVDNTIYGAGTWDSVNNIAPSKNAVRDKFVLSDAAIALNTTHRGSSGSEHADVSSNTAARHAASHNIASHSDTTATGAELETLTGGGDTTLHDHAGISENTTHRGSAGTDHANVGSNNTHRTGNGDDHADVASNTNHRGLSNDPHGSVDDTIYVAGTWDGITNIAPSKNAVRDKFVLSDAAVALNTTHRGQASGHADVATNSAARHAASHTVVSHNDTSATGTQLNTLVGGGDTTLHDHAGISENTTHRSSDGKNHADVVQNTTDIGGKADLISSGVENRIVLIDDAENIKDSGSSLLDVGKYDVAAEWTKQQNFDEEALTSGTAVAWNVNNAQTALLTMGHDATISAPTNLKAGSTYILRVVQGSGPYTLAWNAVFKWGAADTPGAPAANGDVCIFSFYSDGTNLYGVEAIREEA